MIKSGDAIEWKLSMNKLLKYQLLSKIIASIPTNRLIGTHSSCNDNKKYVYLAGRWSGNTVFFVFLQHVNSQWLTSQAGSRGFWGWNGLHLFIWFIHSSKLQLFRQTLCHESVKTYATMPIGIMGSKSLALLYWGSRWFSNKEREKTNTCLCFPSTTLKYLNVYSSNRKNHHYP